MLIFGKNGQVGNALSNISANQHKNVISLSHEQCDLRDKEAIKTMISRSKADVIVNAAAYTNVDKAESEESVVSIINGAAPGWMAEQCAADSRNFVQISTDFVFDGKKNAPYLPDDPTGPLNAYGRSKLLGEERVRNALPEALILRTSWVYASHGSNFLLNMLRLMAERDQLNIVDNQIGSPTSALEIANAIVCLVQQDATGIHHFTNEGVASWFDFAIAIREEGLAVGILKRSTAVSPIPASDYPTPAQRPKNSVLDKQITRKLLGRSISHWRESLRNTIAEIKEND